MTFEFATRARETTQTSGTGTLSLAGATTYYQRLRDAMTSGRETTYLIQDDPKIPTEVEVGRGTFTQGSPDTLTRDEVYYSTNANQKLNLTSGKTYVVEATASGEDMLAGRNNLSDVNDAGNARANIDVAQAITLQHENATGDGTTDDRAALAAADTTASTAGVPLIIQGGTFLIGSDISLTSHLFMNGGILKPDTGATVTLSGSASMLARGQAFDLSAGSFTGDLKGEAVTPFHFGADGTNSSVDEQALQDMETFCTATGATAMLDPTTLNIVNPVRYTSNIFVPKDLQFLPRGNVTVSSSDQIKDALESLDDGDTITVAAGSYTVAGPIKPRTKGLRLTCANKGDVNLTTHWEVGISGRFDVEKIKLIHPSGDDSNAQLFFIWGGLVHLDDLDVDGSNATSGGRFVFANQNGGSLQLFPDSEDMDINYNGGGVDSQLMSFKQGTTLRMAGSERVIVRLDSAAEMIDIDGAGMYLANLFLQGPGKTGSTDGIVLRRGGWARLNRNIDVGVGLFDLRTALRAKHRSRAYLSGNTSPSGPIQVQDNDVGLSEDDGGDIEWDASTISFSGNNTDIESTKAAVRHVPRIFNAQGFTVSNLPTTHAEAGDIAYATDGRKNGETAGNGTGVVVFYDGNNWIAVDSGQTVAA